MNIYETARNADEALSTLGRIRDLTESDHAYCDAALTHAYRAIPANAAEMIDLIDLFLDVEDVDPVVETAFRSIRAGAVRLSAL